MEQKIYSMQFAGKIRANGKGSSLFTRTGLALNDTNLPKKNAENTNSDKARANLNPISFESNIRFADDSSFQEDGVINFSNVDRVYFSTVGTGQILSGKAPNTRHGSVVWKIERGEGQFDGISGVIASNFILKRNQEFLDNQTGQLLLKSNGLQSTGAEASSKDNPLEPEDISFKQVLIDLSGILKGFHPASQPKTESKSRMAKTADYFTHTKTILTTIALILIIVPLAVEIIVGAKQDVVIESFEMPSSFQEKGYTSQAMAGKLAYEINHITEIAHSINENHFRITPEPWNSMRDIQVPTTGLSLRAIALYLRGFMASTPIHLRGNVTIQGSRLDLSILLSDGSINTLNTYVTFSGAPDDIDEPLQQAARYVLKQISPYILAAYFYNNNRLDSSLETIQYCLQHKPGDDDAWAYALWGLILYDRQDYEGAVAKYEKAIALNPKLSAGYINWGRVLENKRDYEGAIAKYKQAADIDPKSALAINNWGYALYLEGKTDEAISKFEQAIELDPELIKPYENLAEIRLTQNNYKDAYSYYELCAARNPNDHTLYNDWGLWLLSQNKYSDAIAKFTKAIEVDPKYSFAFNNRGYASEKQNKNDEAIADYKKAIELNPKYMLAYINWGNTLLKKRNYRQAIDKFKKALEIIPDSLEGYIGLADALAGLRNYSEANILYEKVIKLDSDGVFGKYARETMQANKSRRGKKRSSNTI